MKKRTLMAVILAGLMLSQALVGCAEGKKEDPSNTPPLQASNNSLGNESESEEIDENAELQPDIPDLSFNGETFTFLTSGEADTNGVDWKTYDIWVENTNGDVFNDAVFERNLYIAEKYDTEIAEVQSTADTMSQAKSDVNSGIGDYDAVITNITAAAQLSQGGFLYNLYDIPYINLEKPWWDQRAVEDLSILGDVYFATGDITVIDNDATWVLMFNKQIHEDNGFESLYDSVRENTWTYDKFYSMIQTASNDTNGDGKMNWTTDLFGLCTTGDTCQGLLYASGEKIMTRDSDENPVLISDSERMSNVVEYAGIIMNDSKNVLCNDKSGVSTVDLRIMFEENRSLFYGEVMQCITRMRESETDFGLIPWPKYDEQQDEYYNFVHSTAAKVVTITAAQKNTEFAGAIIEAMAAKSKYTVTPAYYDVCLTYKYMRDEESAEMLDIILDSRCFDLGYVYEWGGLYNNIRKAIYDGSNTFASTWNASQRLVQKTVEKSIKDYNAIKERNAKQ